MRTILLLSALALSACGGTSWPSGSYSAVDHGDAVVLGDAVADYVGNAVPSGTVVSIERASDKDPVAAEAVERMKRDGLVVGEKGRVIRYVAAPLDGGVLLRVSIGDKEGMTRVFQRAVGGTLSAGGPMMVALP